MYCYFPACLVFKEIGADHPKRCYTTPSQNVKVSGEYREGSQLPSSDSFEN